MRQTCVLALLAPLAACAWGDGPSGTVMVEVELTPAALTSDLGYRVAFDAAWLVAGDVELFADGDRDVVHADHGHAHGHQEPTGEEEEPIGWILGTTAVDLLGHGDVGQAAVPEGEVGAMSLTLAPSRDLDLPADAPEELGELALFLHGSVTHASHSAIELTIEIDEGAAVSQIPVHVQVDNDTTSPLRLVVRPHGALDGIDFATLAGGAASLHVGHDSHHEVAHQVLGALVAPSAWAQETHPHEHD